MSSFLANFTSWRQRRRLLTRGHQVRRTVAYALGRLGRDLPTQTKEAARGRLQAFDELAADKELATVPALRKVVEELEHLADGP